MKKLLAVLILGAALPNAAFAIPAVRQALISDIENMQAFVPASVQDKVTVDYRASLDARHQEALKPQNLASINALRARFEKERNDYFNALYAVHHRDFGDDPAAFQKALQERLDLAVTLRKIEERKTVKLSDAQLRQVAVFRSLLNDFSMSTAEVGMMAQSVGSAQMRHAPRVMFRSDFVPPQTAPEAGLSTPPAVTLAAVTPASWSWSPSSVLSGLSHLITSVAHKSSDYAHRVADAIVNSSAARNIDARLSAALVWAESTFTARVGSWAGCYGLGQLSEGVAKSYGVKDRGDIAQNMHGTTGFLKSLLDKYSTHDDRAYLAGLFAQNAAKVRRGADLDATFAAMWPSIPVGVEDAVASYNAGSVPGHWYNLPLPRASHQLRRKPDSLTFLALKGKLDSRGRPLVDHCYDRPSRDSSYCQTVAYVPKVLKNYFTVFIQTAPAGAPQSEMAAGDVIPAGNNG